MRSLLFFFFDNWGFFFLFLLFVLCASTCVSWPVATFRSDMLVVVFLYIFFYFEWTWNNPKERNEMFMMMNLKKGGKKVLKRIFWFENKYRKEIDWYRFHLVWLVNRKNPGGGGGGGWFQREGYACWAIWWWSGVDGELAQREFYLLFTTIKIRSFIFGWINI